MHIGSSSIAVAGPRPRRRRHRPRFFGTHLVWSGLLRVMQRIVHYKHGDRLEFKLNFSVRDLLSDKSRAVRDQFESLVQAVQKAGSYQAKEEAARAMHAVMSALRELAPPDALTKLTESLPVREVARIGRAAGQRLQRGGAAVVADGERSEETPAVSEVEGARAAEGLDDDLRSS